MAFCGRRVDSSGLCRRFRYGTYSSCKGFSALVTGGSTRTGSTEARAEAFLPAHPSDSVCRMVPPFRNSAFSRGFHPSFRAASGRLLKRIFHLSVTESPL